MGCGLAGRRELHAAFLRTEYASEQPCMLRVRGLRPDVRADEGNARNAGARSPVREAQSPARSRRRGENGRLALSQRPCLSAGPGLSLSPHVIRGMGVSGSRPQRAQAMNRIRTCVRRPSRTRTVAARCALPLAAFLATVAALSQPVAAADMNKVIHHVF